MPATAKNQQATSVRCSPVSRLLVIVALGATCVKEQDLRAACGRGRQCDCGAVRGSGKRRLGCSYSGLANRSGSAAAHGDPTRRGPVGGIGRRIADRGRNGYISGPLGYHHRTGRVIHAVGVGAARKRRRGSLGAGGAGLASLCIRRLEKLRTAALLVPELDTDVLVTGESRYSSIQRQSLPLFHWHHSCHSCRDCLAGLAWVGGPALQDLPADPAPHAAPSAPVAPA